jgi:hypothetical protein
MGKGKLITCRGCGAQDAEQAAAGLCFKCYRAEERLIAGDPEAAAEALERKKSRALKVSQAKMRDGVFGMVKHLDTFREHGHASGFFDDDSTVCDDLARMLGPLMDKAKAMAMPGPVLLAPHAEGDPNYPRTVLGREYPAKAFVGGRSVAENGVRHAKKA